MKSAQILREKIQGRMPTFGIIATYHFWFDLVEIARKSGLDYIIIDQEHHSFDSERVAEACALARMIDFPVLIRPPETEYSHIRLAADKGPAGFLLPMIESAATLDTVREALYMPPRGRRRPGGPANRWPADFQYATWRDTVENDFIVLPQIENLTGLKNAEAIARHDLTTAMAIGPYDLSAHLGVCWDSNHPKLQEAIAQIRQAGAAAGKNTWMIGDGASLRRQGFTLICLGEPSAILEGSLKNQVSALRA